jgi:AraC-like DNA-binding protein
VQISEHASDLGRWRTWRWRPPAPTRSFVRNIMGSQSSLPHPLTERHMPSLSMALVINFGSPHRLGDGWSGRALGLDAWLVGLQSAHRLGEAVGEREFMVVQLTAIGAHLILRGLHMALVADQITPLDEIDPQLTWALADRLSRARSWPERFEAIEAVIAGRLVEATPPQIATQALRTLVTTAGRASISRLADELGCSHRHLIGQFRQSIGVPPKTAARLIRFGRALAAIDRAARVSRPDGRPYLDLAPDPQPGHGRIPWAAFAAACGYYDQPHFIRDFHALAGSSPGAFLRRLRPEAAA